MKFFAAVVAICLLCQAAAAQTPDCKSVSNPGARLACYDKAAPLAAATATPRARECKVEKYLPGLLTGESGRTWPRHIAGPRLAAAPALSSSGHLRKMPYLASQ